MGTPSSVRIINYVDLAFKLLEIVYQENDEEFEVLADRNGNRNKEVGKGKSVIWGRARTKDEGPKCELTKKMFFHSDLLKLIHKGKRNITDSFPANAVFYGSKLQMRTN